ncbi:hypothetical protein IEE84_05745 [Psychrobacter sp. 28M-43]|uniref:hypothetical protein n=1 Tax=Psychrobacter sp. 28M-43 TaxID=2772254 RepID=UPI00168CD996|nr:hypothetical protein [Psychrobacter sp. 28M-43]QOD13774.1 hypothetical protein IEE84_05745 [Psychrobacter sp. 28M-43]
MILFLISNYSGFNTGRGGHYYSLRQMAETIAQNRKIVTVVMGDSTSLPAALLGMQNVHSVSTELHKQQKGVKNVIIKLKELKYLSELTAVHAYDAKSTYIGAHIAKMTNTSFILTKCGGRVPKKFYPKVNSLIVFHKKDYDYFSKQKNNYQNVHLIPNRVKPALYEENRQYQIHKIRNEHAFNVLKIGRIGSYYFKTLTDTIKFCSHIQSKDFPIRLSFIGYEESGEVTEKLRVYAEQLNVSLSIYSDSDYTSQASELLWSCDAAVGTGRGAMEALSAGKILLFPVSNFDYPCLFNEKTATYAMQDNFSERTILPEQLSGYCDPSNILSLITDSAYRHKLNAFGYETFNSDFNVEVGARKVLEIYDNSPNIIAISRWNFLMLLLHNMKLHFKQRSKSFRHKLKAVVG